MGLNFSKKYHIVDHEIVVADPDYQYKYNKLNTKTTHFSNVEKADRPFGKNAHKLRQEAKEALFQQSSGAFDLKAQVLSYDNFDRVLQYTQAPQRSCKKQLLFQRNEMLKLDTDSALEDEQVVKVKEVVKDGESYDGVISA